MPAGPVGQRPISTTRIIEMTYFGIHWTPDGIAFLEQGGPKGGSNALGLPTKSPFRIVTRKQCNHNIPLASPSLNPAHLEMFSKISNDPLFVAMLPLPKDQDSRGMWFIDNPDDQLGLYIRLLSRMSSPITGIVYPIWSMKLQQINDELSQTNVQPLVLIDVQPKDTEVVSRLSQLGPLTPRRLVMCGHQSVILPPQIPRLTTKLTEWDLKDLIILPWEAFGAMRVKRYMRNET